MGDEWLLGVQWRSGQEEKERDGGEADVSPGWV